MEEVVFLKELQRNEKYKKDYVKITTLLMLDLGCGFDLVGKSLGIDSSTVRRYLNTYVNVGLDNYLESNYHINTGKLSEDQKNLLKLELVENLHLTSQSICNWIKVEFDLIYTAEGLVSLLHRLG